MTQQKLQGAGHWGSLVAPAGMGLLVLESRIPTALEAHRKAGVRPQRETCYHHPCVQRLLCSLLA
eukprot:scaffold134375_cov75-Phaeocystis_antarctica.AAC.1